MGDFILIIMILYKNEEFVGSTYPVSQKNGSIRRRWKTYPLPCLSPHPIIISQRSKQMSAGRKKTDHQV